METSAAPAMRPEQGISLKPWGIPAILIALALPLLLWGSSLAIALGQDEPAELSDGEVLTGLVLTIILDFVLIGIAAGLSLWRHRLAWSELGLRAFDLSNWWLPIAAAGAAQIGVIVYALVLVAIGGEGAAPDQELDELFDSRAVLPLAGVATVIMAPLAEEIFFRGFVFAGLLRPVGLRWALVLSGLLFGVFHVTGTETISLIAPFAVIGAIFAWVYYRTGSLWISIATHFLFNLVSFVALALTVST